MQRTQGGHEQSGPPPQERLNGLDAKGPDFKMRFARLVRACLALGKEEGGAFAKKKLEIHFDLDRSPRRRRDHDQEPRWEVLV